MSQDQYKSPYLNQGGPVLTSDGKFHYLPRKITAKHRETGYWSFNSEGPGQDDDRAHSHNIPCPEHILLEEYRGHSSPDDIVLRWIPGKMDTFPYERKGTAKQLLPEIIEERLLLGIHSQIEGFPVYPVDADGKILMHRMEQYKDQFEQAHTSSGNSALVSQGSSLSNSHLQYRLVPSTYVPSPLAGLSGVPPHELHGQSSLRLPPFLRHSDDIANPPPPYSSPYGPISPQSHFHTSIGNSPSHPTGNITTSVIPQEYWPELDNSPSHNDPDDFGNMKAKGSEQSNVRQPVAVSQQPMKLVDYGSSDEDNDELQSPQDEAGGIGKNSIDADSLFGSLRAEANEPILGWDQPCGIGEEATSHDLFGSTGAEANEPTTGLDEACNIGEDYIKDSSLFRPPGAGYHEPRKGCDDSLDGVGNSSVSLQGMPESDSSVFCQPAADDTADYPYEHDDASASQSLGISLPCIDCQADSGHTVHCNIGGMVLKPPEAFNILQLRRIAEAVELFDPEQWREHQNPSAPREPESLTSTASELAAIIREQDSYKTDPDLNGRNLPDEVLVLLWAFKGANYSHCEVLWPDDDERMQEGEEVNPDEQNETQDEADKGSDAGVDKVSMESLSNDQEMTIPKQPNSAHDDGDYVDELMSPQAVDALQLDGQKEEILGTKETPETEKVLGTGKPKGGNSVPSVPNQTNLSGQCKSLVDATESMSLENAKPQRSNHAGFLFDFHPKPRLIDLLGVPVSDDENVDGSDAWSGMWSSLPDEQRDSDDEVEEFDEVYEAKHKQANEWWRLYVE